MNGFTSRARLMAGGIGMIVWFLCLPLQARDLRQLANQAVLAPAFPPGTRVERAAVRGDVAEVSLAFPPGFTARKISEARLEEMVRAFFSHLDELPGVKGFFLRAGGEGGGRPLTDFLLPIEAVPPRPHETPGSIPTPSLVPAEGSHRSGFLNGKMVVISPGHGWTWTSTLNRWATQRGNTHGVVEDLSNAESVDAFLVRYLVNAGAQVVPVREIDMQDRMVIVDNDDAHPERGLYREEGDFTDSSNPGFANDRAPYTDGENPFEAGGNRIAEITPQVTARAVWTPNIPEQGTYGVYITFSSYSYRATDAHYTVRHAAGEAHFRVNQRQHGGTWVYLGAFPFRPGLNEEQGSVVLTNDSGLAEANVSADAVRFGGGMGEVERPGGLSGFPKYEENSRSYCQFAGAPPSVYDYRDGDGDDDVITRSRYAAWFVEEGDDAVYLSWHSNAGGGTGTSTYVYGPNEPNGQYIFTGTAGSDSLGRLIHEEMIYDLRATIDPEWRDRGLLTAWFGELNPDHNDETPSALIEVAFHDHEDDAAHLKDPRFRQIVARAVYQGIARYFAERDSVPVRFLPEPPEWVRVRSMGAGSLSVAWAPSVSDGVGGDGATSYRVYTSRDGFAFDEVLEASSTEVSLEGLTPHEPLFVRVTAVNEGGESFPTATLGASPGASPSPVLVVNAFDRLNMYQMVDQDLNRWSDGIAKRMFLELMNTYAYLVPHGESIALAGFTFDGADNEALLEGDVRLEDYQAVIWMAGEESTNDESFDDGEQEAVRRYIEGGGRIMVSGSEIGWDLVEYGSPSDVAFFRDILHAEYISDDSGTYEFEGIGVFAGLAGTFDDGSHGIYNVDYPDELGPLGGGQACLVYPSGVGAAICTSGPAGGVILLGFPLEAVVEVPVRHELIARGLAFLEVEQPVMEPDGGAVDVGVDGGGTDRAMVGPDWALPDMLLPDILVPDVAVPDVVLPDLVLGDGGLWDWRWPDWSMPDWQLPDWRLPDIAYPDWSAPDGDQGTAPDLAGPEDLALPDTAGPLDDGDASQGQPPSQKPADSGGCGC